MPETEHSERPSRPEPIGPARDFSSFVELEFERRRSSLKDFDADLFDEAVALVLEKLKG